MKIGFDLRPLRHHWGRGVGKFWQGFLSALLNRTAEDEYVLYLTEGEAPSLSELLPGFSGGLGRRLRVCWSRPYWGSPSWAWEQWTAPRYNRSDKLDVFHASVQRNIPLWGGGNVVAQVFDMMPIVNAGLYVEKRGGWVGPAIKLYERYLKIALPRVGRIIAISEHTKRDVVDIARVEADRVRVVPLAVEERFRVIEGAFEAVRRKFRVPGPYLLYAGGIEYRKGCDVLLRAFRGLAGSYPDLFLVLVGRTTGRYPAEVVRTAGALGLKDRVVFTGYVPEEDLPLLYNGAEVFVYPSSYEGFGLPVLEAMACGAAVVTTSAASLPEVAGDAALLVPPGDADALAAGIEALLVDSDRRRDFGTRGVARASGFTWDRVVRDTLAVYREI